MSTEASSTPAWIEEVARNSPVVAQEHRMLMDRVTNLSHPARKRALADLFHGKRPILFESLQDPTQREVVAGRLVAFGLLRPDDADRLLPPVAAASFVAAPGGASASHHSYPGGLALHVASNLRRGESFLSDLEASYGLDLTEEREELASAVLWHDTFKPYVFTWSRDGEIVDWEVEVAGVGSHHVFAVAEGIKRELGAVFSLRLACAHIRPDDEGRLHQVMQAAHILAEGEGDPAEWAAARIGRVVTDVVAWAHHFSDATHPFTIILQGAAAERLRSTWEALDDRERAVYRSDFRRFYCEKMAGGFERELLERGPEIS